MDDNQKLKEVLKHLRIIRDKTANLDNYLNSLKSKLTSNVNIDSEGYKVSAVDSIQNDVNDINATFRDYTIPSIKQRVEK